jgi:hypothetical protein
MERGDFTDLPGLGKPLEDLGPAEQGHDPDWWLKRLVEREKITVLPPALQLRRDDAALDDHLDRLGGEAEVRRELTEFNDRVRRVLYSTHGGPPVTTRPRDVEEEVRRWRARREERRARRTAALAAREPEAPPPSRRGRWWPFRRTGAAGPSDG